MNSFKALFGQKLKQIRKNKNFTQEKLAECVDINLRQLARIEAGESFVTADTLCKICNVLGITPDTLFKFSLTQKDENKNFSELIHKLEKISYDNKKIEFMSIALNSLNNKKSLEKLKMLIKGIELNL